MISLFPNLDLPPVKAQLTATKLILDVSLTLMTLLTPIALGILILSLSDYLKTFDLPGLGALGDTSGLLVGMLAASLLLAAVTTMLIAMPLFERWMMPTLKHHPFQAVFSLPYPINRQADDVPSENITGRADPSFAEAARAYLFLHAPALALLGLLLVNAVATPLLKMHGSWATLLALTIGFAMTALYLCHRRPRGVSKDASRAYWADGLFAAFVSNILTVPWLLVLISLVLSILDPGFSDVGATGTNVVALVTMLCLLGFHAVLVSIRPHRAALVLGTCAMSVAVLAMGPAGHRVTITALRAANLGGGSVYVFRTGPATQDRSRKAVVACAILSVGDTRIVLPVQSADDCEPKAFRATYEELAKANPNDRVKRLEAVRVFKRDDLYDKP